MAHRIPGPDPKTKISPDYVRLVARDAFFWSWPIVNVYSRRLALEQTRENATNQLMMPAGFDLADRATCCPDADLVHGHCILALDRSPVVIQVPDFRDRFWAFQVMDARTDCFAELGAMYASKPGFYLLVGPNWVGSVPPGIGKVFASQTSTGIFVPRVYCEEDERERDALQPTLNRIGVYPVDRFDGTAKVTDWLEARQPGASPAPRDGGEIRWVLPEDFLALLPRALADATPMPGESARYAQVLDVMRAASRDATLRAVFEDAVEEAERDLIDPLLAFHNHGLALPYHWTTVVNGAAFGTDYFTRTAVAKSNIFVARSSETKCFYLDFDANRDRLDGSHGYTLTFMRNGLPPVHAFWSLALYNARHFLEPNPPGRYSISTRSRALVYERDGSLTIHIQATSPGPAREGNWLPTPTAGQREFSLYLRCYWPEQAALDGSWSPPAVLRLPHPEALS